MKSPLRREILRFAVQEIRPVEVWKRRLVVMAVKSVGRPLNSERPHGARRLLSVSTAGAAGMGRSLHWPEVAAALFREMVEHLSPVAIVET